MALLSFLSPRSSEPEHSTYVQIIDAGGFFASCRRCGPGPFPNRLILAVAEADARRHGTLRHAYDEDTLREHNQRTADSLPLT